MIPTTHLHNHPRDLPTSAAPYTPRPIAQLMNALWWVASPMRPLTQFVRNIMSPVLADTPSLRCDHIRNGGLHRH